MDITVRVEVQYVAPEHALVRDVLRMFRSPAWVRFMVRYISPHLKNAAPADKTVLDSLSRWTLPDPHSNNDSNSSSSSSSNSSKKRAAPDCDCDCDCDADSCVICMSALQTEPEIETEPKTEAVPAVRLPCGHRFHAPCIRSWLQLRSTCPSCRFQFRKAFSGSYAVRTLNSALLLQPEHRALAKEAVLRMPVGRETVRAVVNVTLSQLPPDAPQSQYPCVLNALLMHANGDSFTEAAALGKNGVEEDAAATRVRRADELEDGDDDVSSPPRNKRLRVA